jgi:hypothetical protein
LRKLRFLVLALACALVLTGCGDNSKTTPKKTPAAKLPSGWTEMTTPGFTDNYVAVAYLSRGQDSSMATDDAFLAFINAKGGVKMEKVAPIENGIVRSQGRTFAFDGEKDTFFVAGGDSTSYRRPGDKIGSGHWASLTASGWDVSVLNIGRLEDGYLTEVNSQNGSAQIRNEIRDVPGSVGMDKDTLYLLSAGSSNTDGTVSLHRVDVTKEDSSEQVLEFRPFPNPKRMAFDALSDLHVTGDLIWFTYYQTPISNQGEFLNKRRTLRLGRIDLATKSFSSTKLSDNAYLLGDGPKGTVPVSVAGLHGYLRGGLLYTINTAGEIIAIDLKKSTITTVGMVNQAARTSFRVLPSWRGNDLTLLSIDGQGGAVLQTYSLKNADMVGNINIPELGSWYAQHLEILPWSVAQLG